MRTKRRISKYYLQMIPWRNIKQQKQSINTKTQQMLNSEDTILDINCLKSKKMINVFPNPTSNGSFTIDLENYQTENAIVLIFNPEGKLIFHKRFLWQRNRPLLDIDMKNNIPGVYNLQIMIEKKIYYQKLIVN